VFLLFLELLTSFSMQPLLTGFSSLRRKGFQACFFIALPFLSTVVYAQNQPFQIKDNESYQTDTLKFIHLTTTDGLSNSNVFGITQDHQGFIWFATEDGLNRFDGNNFVTYRHNDNDPHSIADNVIRKIFIDSENTLWVGTENGLSRYNLELDNFDTFTHHIDNNHSLRDNIIWDIYQNKKSKNQQFTNLLWVSTSEGLHTLQLNTNKLTFTRIDIRGYNNKFKEIKTIFQDKQNTFWFGSYDNGIHLVSKNFTYIGSLQEKNKYDLQVNAQALYDGKVIDNNYWLATDNGLFIVDDDYKLLSHLTATNNTSKNEQSLLSNNIRAITQYDDSHVWIATHKGLNIVNLVDDTITSHQNNKKDTSLSENWLMGMYKDNNNHL